MAYAQKYNFQMLNDQGTLVEVQIFSNGYSGGVTTLIGGSQPVVIEYNAVSDRTQGIRDSTCTLNMISQAGFDLSTIYTTDERQYRVDVYYNAALYWTGFVTQDFSNEPFMEIGTYEIQIIARCGLVGLQGFKFLNQSGYYLFGYITMTQLLAILFAKTGLQLYFYVCMNIYETRMNTANCAFDQMYVNTQRFFGSDGLPMQCSDILEAVCQAFGLIVFQRSGNWVVYRQYEMPAARYFSYDYTGTFYSSGAAFSLASNYGPAYPLKMINGDQMVGYDQGWQEVKQNYTFAYLLNAVQDGQFYVWSGTYNPIYWTSTFTGGVYLQPQQSTPFGVKWFSNSTINTAYYFQSIGVQALQNDTLYMSLVFDGTQDLTQSFYYDVMLVSGGTTKYWNGGNTWSSSTSSYRTGIISLLTYEPVTNTYIYSLSTLGTPNPIQPNANGTIYLRLYGVTGGAVATSTTGPYTKLVQADLYKVDPTSAPNKDSSTPIPTGLCFDDTQTASTFTYMPDTKDIMLGDSPSQLYAGALCLDTVGTVTVGWKRYGVSENRPLLSIVTGCLMDLHKKPYRVFQGSTYGIMYYGDCWLIQGLSGSNYYLPDGTMIDLKNMQGSLTATEHDPTTGTYSQAITILYNKNPNFVTT